MHTSRWSEISLDSRYEIGEQLAETDHSVVFRGRDLESERAVCVKLLKRSTADSDAEALHRFRREALTLSEISNRNVVRVFELGVFGGGPAIVMELLEGRSLSEVIDEGTLSLVGVLRVLTNIAEGLEHIHRLGIIHRDIKPANIVLIDEISNEIRIIDFGFAALRARPSLDAEGVVGTLRYMSPEQAGLICRPVGEKADLYALGCIAYELLAGVPAFGSLNTDELLRSIQCEAPTPLRSFAPELPVVLEHIVERLLAKNPDDRYQTAESVALDLGRLLIELEAQRAAPIFTPDQAQPNRSRLTGRITVGRDAQLASVMGLSARAAAGKPQIVLVSGKSGTGKSTFVYQVINNMMMQGARSIQGKCYTVSGRSPWSALSDLLSDLYGLYKRLPQAEQAEISARLSADLQDSAGHLLRLAPEWGHVIPSAEEAAYEGNEKDLALAAQMLRKTLAPFANSSRAGSGAPMLVFLDNLQWGDSATLRLLSLIATEVQDLRIMWMCAYRSDEVDENAPVQELIARSQQGDSPIQLVDILPLSAREVQELMERWLGVDVPSDIATRVHEQAAGNAFFVWEVLRAYERAGVFIGEGGDTRIDANAVMRVELPANLVDILLLRLRNQSAAAQKLLGMAAMYGHSFSFSLLASCGELGENETYDAIASAEAAGLISGTQGEHGFLFAFEHDQIQSACAEFIEETEAVQIHLRIGEWLEEESRALPGAIADDVVHRLAHHFRHSDQAQKAMDYVGRAAKLSMAAMDNQLALEHYEALLALMESQGIDERDSRRMAAVLDHAELHDRLGNFEEAEVIYTASLAHASDDVATASITAKLAHVQQKRGQFKKSQANLVSALHQLGERVGVGQETLEWEVPRETWHAEIRTLLSRGIADDLPTPDERAQLTADLLTRLWYYHSFYDTGLHNEKMYYLAYRLLGFVGKYADSSELAVAHRVMSITFCQGDHPQFEESIKHAFRSVDVARRIDAKMAAAVGYCYIGIVMVWQSRDEEAVSYLEQAQAMLERLGNPWEVVNTHIFLMMCKRNLGQVEAALGHALEIVRVAERSQAAGSMAAGYWKVADLLLMRGEERLGKEYLEKAIRISRDKDLHFDHFNALKVRARMQLDAGHYAAAREDLATAMQLIDSNQFMRAYVYDTHVGLAESYIREVVATDLAAEEREANLQKAEELLDTAITMETRYLRHIAFAYRVQARLFAAQGDTAGAEKAIDTARKIIVRDGRILEQPKLLEVEADLLREGAPDRAQLLYKQARVLWADFGAPGQVRRLDQKIAAHQGGDGEDQALSILRKQGAALLQVSLATTGLLQPEQQARSVLDALIEVCSADRAFLFLAPEGETGDGLRLSAARNSDGEDITSESTYSSTVVARVRDSREPLVITGTEEGELIGSHSAVMYDLRSIMAAPLICRDRFIGVVYLDNRLDKMLRADEDVQFLQAMANQIAISLDGTRAARLEVERTAMANDLALTAVVQTMFLPENKITSHGDLRVTGICRSADQAGGDWWWLDTTNSQSLRIVLGDVVGHGVASAMVTAAMVSLCRHILRGEDARLGACLRSLHTELVDLCDGKYPMALVGAEVDLASHTLRWWAGGTPQPLLMTPAGVEVVLGSGNSIGAEEFQMHERTLDFGPGCRLLLMTDGILEQVTSKGRPFGLKKLMRAFAETRGLPLDAARDSILAACDLARGACRQDDDVSVVLIERFER